MLSATDKLLVGYLAALSAIAITLHHDPLPHVLPAAMLAAALITLAGARERSEVARVAHDFAALPAVVACFMLSGPVAGGVNPERWDLNLAAADARWFGVYAVKWAGALGRPSLLTDAASLAYLSYYFAPIAVAVTLYQRDREAGRQLVFALTLTFVGMWIGYLVLPAVGPRVPVAAADAVLGGGVVSRGVRLLLRIVERNKIDAFPSGHTAVSLVVYALGARGLPRWRLPLGALATAIIFSTVYLSLHYVTDVAGGFVLASLVLLGVTAFAPPSRLSLAPSAISSAPATVA